MVLECMEKISWIECAGNEEVLHRVNEEKNSLYTIKRMKANWIGHILCTNCLAKMLPKERYRQRCKRREDKDEDVSSY